MADPFEEFEFKPLTEGLGFHKKADTLKSDIKSTIASNVASSAAINAQPSRSTIFPEAPPARRASGIPDAKPAPTKSFGEDLAREMAPRDLASRDLAGGPIESSFGGAGSSSKASAVETSRAASQSISELMASLPPSLDFLDDKQDLTRKSEMPLGSTPMAPGSSRPQIFQPLAREEYKSTIATGPTVGSVLPAPGTKAGSQVSTAAAIAAPLAARSAGGVGARGAMGTGALGGLSSAGAGAPAMNAPTAQPGARVGYRERMMGTFAKAFPKTETMPKRDVEAKEGLVPVATNFSAALIDAMVVAGISTILLVCIITITHINLVAMLGNASTDYATQKNLVFLFFAVLQMYMLISRSFFGASLGEWAFELQLGTSEQARQLAYPALVLWRMIFITFTGVIVVPLLSFAFGRDLASYLSGLQLYRRT